MPDLATVRKGLASVLGHDANDFEIVERSVSVLASTYVNEVVRCRRRDGFEFRLFCKYSGGRGDNAYGHRGSVGYEGLVYGAVLRGLPVTTPRFMGTYRLGDSGDTCLVLEHLEGVTPLTWRKDVGSFERAARWIAEFHSLNEARVDDPNFSFLRSYDEVYYLGWVGRTRLYSSSLRHRYPWLEPLCGRTPSTFRLLLEGPQTIVHGEFYGKNVVAADDTVWPVDWESAARAAGEIDLASLTERWPEDVVLRCERAYRETKWPGGAPAEHSKRLDVARLYLALRWLGDRAEWTRSSEATHRFEELRSLGERLGVI
ncbi:MAG: hypothetical protein M3279_09130 [Actinomycetota bacterium]|nr:hypothetical protein [Actinomycetota bacterium]